MPWFKSDAIDLRILLERQIQVIHKDLALASRVGLSPSPCVARVRALESAGVIDRYVAIA